MLVYSNEHNSPGLADDGYNSEELQLSEVFEKQDIKEVLEAPSCPTSVSNVSALFQNIRVNNLNDDMLSRLFDLQQKHMELNANLEQKRIDATVTHRSLEAATDRAE